MVALTPVTNHQTHVASIGADDKVPLETLSDSDADPGPQRTTFFDKKNHFRTSWILCSSVAERARAARDLRRSSLLFLRSDERERACLRCSCWLRVDWQCGQRACAHIQWIDRISCLFLRCLRSRVGAV